MIQQDCNTPLMVAIESKSLKVATILIQHGCDTMVMNKVGGVRRYCLHKISS